MMRMFDVVGALVLLVLGAPVLALAVLAILVTMGPPALFRQTRTGIRGRPFVLLKLRTMRSRSDVGTCDEERLTTVGRLLRATSADELPQLWNVLRGDMALVGPRPLLPEYLERYSPEQARRHEVKPGITGLAQVCGRNGLTWARKFRLDVWYVDHRTLGLDLWILSATVKAVAGGRGVAAPGHATMPEFVGEPRRRPA
jgi:lipopolysaccharide/colanic/teichoic acid biosynthesis glycosyltransferase